MRQRKVLMEARCQVCLWLQNGVERGEIAVAGGAVVEEADFELQHGFESFAAAFEGQSPRVAFVEEKNLRRSVLAVQGTARREWRRRVE